MKDILFNIYKYEITKNDYYQTNMFKPANAGLNKSNLEFFEKQCIGNKGSVVILREIKVNKDKDGVLNRQSVESTIKEDHKAKILEHRGGIAIINVQANKTKTLHDENFETDPKPDFPPFLVIIDNRPKHQYIAIQQGVMSSTKAARILFDTFNYNMLESNRKFDLQKLHKNLTFNEAMFHMKERLGKAITKVAFEFDKKQETKNKLPESVDHFLKEWVGRFSNEGKIETLIGNDEDLKKEDVARDFELLGHLCLENKKYKLSAWFGKLGVYRYGKEIGAQLGMNASIISDFVNPREPIYVEQSFLAEEFKEEQYPTLEEWLDKLKNAFDDYEKTSLSITGRRKRSRRPL